MEEGTECTVVGAAMLPLVFRGAGIVLHRRFASDWVKIFSTTLQLIADRPKQVILITSLTSMLFFLKHFIQEIYYKVS